MADDFSLAAMIRAVVTETWNKTKSYERTVVSELNECYGHPDRNGVRLPFDVLVQRDLNVSSPSAGGHLVETQVRNYIDSLQTASVVQQLGAQTDTISGANVLVVTGKGGVVTKWASHELDTATESTPLMGATAVTPKLLIAFCELSRKILQQSNAEDVVRRELRNAAGAALDRAVLSGSGAAGEPLGLTKVPGTHAVAGASLAYAGIVESQTDVGNGDGVVNRATLGWVTTPAVAGTLKQRYRVANTDSPLWSGDANDGTIDGKPALSTTAMAAATMAYGDWSSLLILAFAGGLQIELDPFSKFNMGIVGVRLIMPVDVVVTRPASFAVTSSIS